MLIIFPLGIGGGKIMRTRTAVMMTKQEDAARIIQAPPHTAANTTIITAVADADVVVKDDLVFASGTITATSYIVPTPGWAVPLQPPPSYFVIIIVIIIIVVMASSPLTVVKVVVIAVGIVSCCLIALLCAGGPPPPPRPGGCA